MSNVTSITPKTYRLNVRRKSPYKFPEFWGSVYLSGPAAETMPFIPMLAQARCDQAKTVGDADIVIFAGGADVDPQLYGQKPHAKTHTNPKRDEEEMGIYQKCLDEGIPMIGVCRGAQFGWVMRGGALYQDVDGHMGAHSMTDIVSGEIIERVSSVHHQMCRPFPADYKGATDLTIIGITQRSYKRYYQQELFETGGSHEDIEAYFFKDNCFLGVQGHPEYAGYDKYTNWFLRQVEQYIINNPNVGVIDKKYRLKQTYKEALLARSAA